MSRGHSRRMQLSKEQVLDSLTACQRKAVENVKAKAKPMHDMSFNELNSRISGLGGFLGSYLQECLKFIRDDAPIVIHLTENTLSLLVNDTRYRNFFETTTSGGSFSKDTRSRWESAMFGTAYRGCSAFERPKYGDIERVKSAREYGKLFLTIHQDCRHRCTLFNDDTGDFDGSEPLAANEFYAHILNGYDDAD